MSLEFPCSSCGALIRTPDAAAGKKARCPSCQAVVDVPAASQDQASQDQAEQHERAQQHDRAQLHAAYQPPGIEPTESPFAKPAVTSAIPEDLQAAVFGPPIEMQSTPLTLDEMLQRSWAIFVNRLGILVLFALIFIGLNMAAGILTSVINMGTQIAAQITKEIWLVFLGQGISQIISFVVSAYVTAGGVKYTVQMSRYGEAPFTLLLSGWPYLGRSLLLNLLIVLLVYGVPGVLGVPGYIALAQGAEVPWIVAGFAPAVLLGIPLICWLVVTLYLAMPLIVDRDYKLMDAVRTSHQMLRGSKWIVFVGMALVGFLSGLFTIMTCLIGSVFAFPFAMIFNTVVYLLATGQGMPLDSPKSPATTPTPGDSAPSGDSAPFSHSAPSSVNASPDENASPGETQDADQTGGGSPFGDR